MMPAPIKPYRSVPIRECGEPLLPIPSGAFVLTDPHPYQAAGAPYGNTSPWILRRSILAALSKAQQMLTAQRPGWRIKLFDAYRPNAVQAYMVELEFRRQAQAAGIDPNRLNDEQRELLAPRVFSLWGIPSEDPTCPPPHSTGAAIDCTLVDESGIEIEMGSPIDENSPRSLPDAFAAATDRTGEQAHENREFLKDIMAAGGFARNPREWWHFSQGDQLAVWATKGAIAIYGRADLLDLH